MEQNSLNLIQNNRLTFRGFNLTLKSDFANLREGASRNTGRYLVCYYKKSNSASLKTQFAISVSKKFGCAVKRNKMKRLIKESFRQFDPHLKYLGIDILIVVKNNINFEELNFRKINTDMLIIFSRFNNNTN